MKEERLTCEKARTLCLVDTMARLGHFPVRQTEKEAWFLSPFRTETQASFKVSRTLNRWYDHGEGVGGNVIDLVCRLNRASVPEALEFLAHGGTIVSIQRRPMVREAPKIQIGQVLSVGHPALLEYLSQRRIPPTLAHGYLKQVHFTLNAKNYFALGFQNDKGGWELRNKFQKYCCSPKAITQINNGASTLTLVEGMFDFLSLMVLRPEWFLDSDVLVLNSLAFASKVDAVLDRYTGIHLALDNDAAGDSWTRQLLQRYPQAIDRRDCYAGFKDANEKLMHHGTG